MPKLMCICGPNGAGKSTLSRTIAMQDNILVIDTDKFAAEGLTQIAAGKAAVRMARMFVKEGISFARESTLTAQFDFTLMKTAKEHGYRVELVYIRLSSPELALKRIAARVARGGHDVPAVDVIRRFQRSLDNLPKAMALADRVTVFDNSTGRFVRVSQ